MNKEEAVSAARIKSREAGHSIKTEDTYADWIARFCDYMNCHLSGSIDGFLNGLATGLMGRAPVGPKTQKQALNAINHLYKRVLGKSMGRLEFRYSEKPRRVPACLTHNECHRMFGQMKGLPQLQAQLMYGTGLRISELLSLRIKDIDFEGNSLTVRGGKGDADRIVPLPKALREQVAEQIEKARYWWNVDQKDRNPPPYLPDALATKLGNQIGEFSWFWLFPSYKLSTDKRSGITRRHHCSNAGVAKAMKIAAKRAGILKRISPHSMRHSYATSQIRNHVDIKTLSVLMGHKSTKTTEIYLHCVTESYGSAPSPLDFEPSNVVLMAFEQPQETELASIS